MICQYLYNTCHHHHHHYRRRFGFSALLILKRHMRVKHYNHLSKYIDIVSPPTRPINVKIYTRGATLLLSEYFESAGKMKEKILWDEWIHIIQHRLKRIPRTQIQNISLKIDSPYCPKFGLSSYYTFKGSLFTFCVNHFTFFFVQSGRVCIDILHIESY